MFSLFSVIAASMSCVCLLFVVGPGLTTVHGDPQTYAMVFQNITTDRQAEGFIQIYGVSINQSGMVVQANNNSYSAFATLFQPTSTTGTVAGSNNIFNYTAQYGMALSMPDPQLLNVTTTDFGIIASANEAIWVFGVKSDKGTTDAFMSLPVVNSSTSFFIAGWPTLITFLGQILVVASVDDTCVEIYKVFNGTNYVLLSKGSASINRFQVFRYYSGYELNADQSTTSNGEDLTGYYVNSTKPVDVYFGHECAWVPTISTLFCDYLVEQIPPVSQLGLRYVVPPISGRADSAGYVVRVVPTGPGLTTVSWTSAQISGTGVSMRGQWIQIDQPSCGTPLVVVCSQPCVVMQYNKGYLQVRGDVPTDPFMMLVVPDDRFTGGSGFGTANFCLDRGVSVEFDNWVSIVTFYSYKDNILIDGQTITNSVMGGLSVAWLSITSGGVNYAVTSFRVTHGFHFINFSPGTAGSFAAYVYGHSKYTTSSSAYGYSANYNITGISVKSNWNAAATQYQAIVNSDLNATCQNTAQLTGAIISRGTTQYIKFPFTLNAGISPAVTLSDVCLMNYNNTLFKLLEDFSSKINYWICMSKNCSYLQGKGVAIDYPSLSIQWIGLNQQYRAVQITVTMIGTYDTTAQNFAQCRADIRNYMYPFINWPPSYISNLVTQTVASGCPTQIPFFQPMFSDAPQACPAILSSST